MNIYATHIICFFPLLFLPYPRKKWYNPIMNILEYENYHEDKTHGDMGFPYNTYLCSIPLDFPCVPLHWHDELELIYVKKGMGRITVDFRSFHVKAPAIALILPGQLHSIEKEPDASMERSNILRENVVHESMKHDNVVRENMEYENIIFHPNMLLPKQADMSSTEFLLPLLAGTITVPSVFTPACPYYADISAPIDACDEICKTKPQGYELYIKGQLYLFFFLLNNRCRNLASPTGNEKTLEKMKIILKYVENHYAEKITVKDAAEALGFSESHFMRYFKDAMGTPFIEYLKDYRLTMASRLLTASDSSILNIAAETGFDSLSYFNRAFKAKYHMTPNQFRHTQEQPPHR